MITLQVISVYGVWRVRIRVEIFRRKFHTHIYLDYDIIEFISYKKKIIISQSKNLQNIRRFFLGNDYKG